MSGPPGPDAPEPDAPIEAPDRGEDDSGDPPPLTILHREAGLVVVDKPAGLLVHRTLLDPDRDVVVARARALLGGPVHAVHRLDRATSGVLLLALDPESARRWSEALAEADKRYLGVVRGALPERGVWDRPLSHPGHGGPQAAITEFERVAIVADGAASVARFTLRTGRHHQIRRHLNHAGHHLLGDSKHGKGWLNRDFRARYGLPRMALHAERIELPHPDGGRLAVEAPLPEDLRGFLERLGVTL